MGNILANYKLSGVLNAKFNWVTCGDPNGITNKHETIISDIETLNRITNQLLLNLDMRLTDDEFGIFKHLCLTTETESLLEQEIFIEKKNRPHELGFNTKALIIKTRKHVPEDIAIGLSYGWKFLFPYMTTDDNLHEVLAQMEMCIEQTIPILSQQEAFMEISRILSTRSNTLLDSVVRWLRFIAKRTEFFFKQNNDIFATRSDKGGHTVILELAQYELAIHNMLNNPSYTLVEHNPLTELVKEEEQLMRILSTNFHTKKYVEGKYEPATKQLAKFYGLPKIHKEIFCLRPITAMNMAPGLATGVIFNKMLNELFPRTHYHIKDSYEMKRFADNAHIGDDDVLVSFDVVSMYTCIPRELVKGIIMSKAKQFHSNFGIGKIILEKITDFLLIKCTVFTALDNIYMQNEGLPMGGNVSTTLARMVMDLVAENLILNEPNISFIRIFVDDTIAAVKREYIPNALLSLNNFHPNLRFTSELEDGTGSINFLNLTLTREGKSIKTNWYRKHFASGRLLPYFSSHKRTTIMNTAEAFIRTVIELSDASFFMSNKPIVEKTLRDNGFPEATVLLLMNEHYTLMKQKQIIKRSKKKYKIFPHAICESRKIKRILHKLKYDEVVYAESTRNTKINFVTTRKTPTPIELRGNLVLSSRCVCKRKFKFTATKFNETGQMASRRILTTFRKCEQHRHAFRVIKFDRGLFYRSQTEYLLKYIEWKQGNNTLDRRGLPNYYFVKLFKNKNRRLNN